MSRSGYTDDYDEGGTGGLWRGAVASAIRGKRGQAALREVASALDAMPEKWLAAESLVTAEGEFCTLGVLGAARGMDVSKLDPDDWDRVAEAFDLAPCMVREIVYENDEVVEEFEWVDLVGPPGPREWRYYGHPQVRRPLNHPGERRWKHMRDWVAKQIKD